MDLFVVPALSFRLLYGLLITSHGRPQIFLVLRDSSPHRGMDCQPADGSFWLGAKSSRPDP
jgi:hypothetical protein